MNSDIYSRLIDYAKAEVDAKVNQTQFRGGTNVSVEDRRVSLIQPARTVEEPEESETWQVALFGQWERLSDLLPPRESENIVAGHIPRSVGWLDARAEYWPQDIVEATELPEGAFFIRYRFTLYARLYEPSQFVLPVPPDPAPVDWGSPYPGVIAFDLRQRRASNLELLSTTTIEIPPEGVTFTPIPAISNAVIQVSPDITSFRRVRT